MAAELAEHINIWLVSLLAFLALAGWIAVFILWRSSRATRVRKLTRELEEATRQVRRYREMLDEIYSENTALKEKTEQQDDEIRRLKADNIALHQDLERKQQAIDRLNRVLDRQEKLVTDLTGQVATLKDRVTELAAQLGRLE